MRLIIVLMALLLIVVSSCNKPNLDKDRDNEQPPPLPTQDTDIGINSADDELNSNEIDDIDVIVNGSLFQS